MGDLWEYGNFMDDFYEYDNFCGVYYLFVGGSWGVE